MSKRRFLDQSQKQLSEYYSGKLVAVAGGAGFVGFQLVKLLADLVGAEGFVLVLDDFSRGTNVLHHANAGYAFKTDRGCYYPYEIYNFDEASRWASFRNTGCDVSEPRKYDWMLSDYDIFFNLTAVVAGVLHNENHHLQMYDDNIRVLTGPLRACEQAGVPAYFQTSSVCVYAEDHQSPCLESDGWGGEPNPSNHGYAEAKRDGERAALWSGIPRVVIGRPSNIIGPHDYFDRRAHVVPAFIDRAITTSGDFKAYGSSVVQREFIYSWDVALGMLYAMAFGEDREAYNIGTGGDNTITMLSLASKIISCVKVRGAGQDLSGERRVIFDNSVGGGDEKRYSNADKLRDLGWSHTVGLDLALSRIVNEYLYRGGWKDPDYWRVLGEDVDV